MGLHLREQDLNVLLNEYSDCNFNLEESIDFSKEYLLELENLHEENTCDFKEDHWTIFHEGQTRKLNFDFELTKQNIRFHSTMNESDKNLFIQTIKCWTVSLLSSLDIYSAHKYLRYMNRFILHSNCFDTNEAVVENVKHYLFEINENTKHTAFVTCIAILNFIDFYEEIDHKNTYLKLLTEAKNEIGYSENIRTLPPAKDVFMFSTLVDDYFMSISKISDEYIHYFPILLWWKLTNLIPLRPFEFCSIKRNALSLKEGNYYINLPRSEKKGSKNRNRIQIVKNIKIPIELALEIMHYIELTDNYGSTETLISHKALRSTLSQISKSSGRVNSVDKFYPSILTKLIERFYINIVQNKYGFSIQNNMYRYEDVKLISTSTDSMVKISAGDTRHFAFLNLMRLGYNPVEIARLGGHTSLKTQYHYHSHQEFMLDVEVLKLMSKFRFEKTQSKSLDLSGNSVLSETFNLNELIKQRFVKKPSNNPNIKKKLELGYCTDENQRCLVHDCSLCDFWRISPEEYAENISTISKKVENAYDNTKHILATIGHIHDYITNQYEKDEYMGDLNTDYNRDLNRLSNELNTSLQNYTKLKMVNERNVFDDKKDDNER